jgi:hypothetical protein
MSMEHASAPPTNPGFAQAPQTAAGGQDMMAQMMMMQMMSNQQAQNSALIASATKGSGPTVINNNNTSSSSAAAGGVGVVAPLIVQARVKYVKKGMFNSDCKMCGKPRDKHISYSGDYWCPDPDPDSCCCTIQ